MNADDKAWIRTMSLYEVNLRQYTREGTIKAFHSHLPRLKDMGVSALWFMPITPIAQKNKKGSLGSYYACSHYTRVDPEFGTLEDWKELVQAAHEAGFRVVLDWVANHTGWDHHWTEEHPEWYLRDPQTGDFQRASGMDDIIELDYDQPAMRQAMIEAMSFWVRETGIDGFRCDLADWVCLDFWKEAREALHRIRPLFWLAEMDPLESPDYMQVFDSAYSWTWMHQTKEFYHQNLPFSELEKLLEQYSRVPGQMAWFTSNHDENSWNGTEFEKYGDMAPLLAVFSITWPGLPLMYSGQALPNMKRLPFFERDPIDWSNPCSLHDFYKTLLTLHATNPALHADVPAERIQVAGTAPGVLAFRRRSGDHEMLALMNFSPRPAQYLLPETEVEGRYRNLFSHFEHDFNRTRQMEMKPWEYWIYTR